MTELVTPAKIIRLPELSSRIGLTRTSIYRLISQGKFPKQIKLSLRTSGWLESEVETWILTQANNRNK